MTCFKFLVNIFVQIRSLSINLATCRTPSILNMTCARRDRSPAYSNTIFNTDFIFVGQVEKVFHFDVLANASKVLWHVFIFIKGKNSEGTDNEKTIQYSNSHTNFGIFLVKRKGIYQTGIIVRIWHFCLLLTSLLIMGCIFLCLYGVLWK